MEDHDFVLSHAVIELDNLTISTLREFTVSSLCRARTLSGIRIFVNRRFAAEGEIGAYILSIVNSVKYNKARPISIRRDEEPTIRNPKDIEKIFSSCAASNLSSLQNALSLNVGVFRDLATVRNFYAHRNADTWRKVRNQAQRVGIISIRHPNDFVRAVISGRPVSIFEEWLVEAELFFEEAMK